MGISPKEFQSAKTLAKNFLSARITIRGEMHANRIRDKIVLKSGADYAAVMNDFWKDDEIENILYEKKHQAKIEKKDALLEYYERVFSALHAHNCNFVPRNKEGEQQLKDALEELQVLNEERILPKAIAVIKQIAQGRPLKEEDREILAKCYEFLLVSKMCKESWQKTYAADMASELNSFAEGLSIAHKDDVTKLSPEILTVMGKTSLKDPNNAEDAAIESAQQRQTLKNELIILNEIMPKIHELHNAVRSELKQTRR